jgi:hypothetical protein
MRGKKLVSIECDAKIFIGAPPKDRTGALTYCFIRKTLRDLCENLSELCGY